MTDEPQGLNPEDCRILQALQAQGPQTAQEMGTNRDRMRRLLLRGLVELDGVTRTGLVGQPPKRYRLTDAGTAALS